MATPVEGAWRLSFGAAGGYPAGSLDIGGPSDGPVWLASEPVVGWGTASVEDVPLVREDGIRFGQDFVDNTTITFDLGLADVATFNSGPAGHRAHLDVMAQARRVWRADAVRATPGAVATLETTQAGQSRTFFGRPRRWAIAGADATRLGYTPVICDFVSVDDRVYGTERTLHIAAYASPVGVGLAEPLTEPLVTLDSTDAGYDLVVGGDMPAWPDFVITGPRLNPVIEVVGRYVIALNTTVGPGIKLTVATAPWKRGVLRSGTSGSFANVLSSGTPRLADMAIPPGTWPIAFRGVDATGTSSLDVKVRDAFSGV